MVDLNDNNPLVTNKDLQIEAMRNGSRIIGRLRVRSISFFFNSGTWQLKWIGLLKINLIVIKFSFKNLIPLRWSVYLRKLHIHLFTRIHRTICFSFHVNKQFSFRSIGLSSKDTINQYSYSPIGFLLLFLIYRTISWPCDQPINLSVSRIRLPQ